MHSISGHIFGHVKWFVDEHDAAASPLHSNEWGFVVLALIAGVGALYLVHSAMNRWGANKYLDDKLGRFAPVIPLVVRYTTGLLLIINAAKGLLFAPNVTTGAIPFGGEVSVLLAILGVLLIIGWGVKWVGYGLILIYLYSLAFIDPLINGLDHFEYLGIGAYLALFQDKAYLNWARAAGLARALSPESLLRIGVGIGLMVLALSEKLVGISNSTAFLQLHHWNFLEFAGLADRNFIIIAGVVELLVGLTLVLNIAPRVTTAIVALLMTMTAIALGVEEVFGHLFALSLVAVVWLTPQVASAGGPKPTEKRRR